MNVTAILVNSLWTAVFATGFGVILTTPRRLLLSCFVCGFAGRFLRDVLVASGMSQNWATAVAAAVLVLVAAAITQRHRISPVVLICGVLPLGTAVPIFNTLFEFMKVASLQGDALSAASIALIANAGKAFTGTLAIALGLSLGIAILQFLEREEAEGA